MPVPVTRRPRAMIGPCWPPRRLRRAIAARIWTVFSYMIVYDPAKRPIEILTVVHSARDVSAILEDDD